MKWFSLIGSVASRFVSQHNNRCYWLRTLPSNCEEMNGGGRRWMSWGPIHLGQRGRGCCQLENSPSPGLLLLLFIVCLRNLLITLATPIIRITAPIIYNPLHSLLLIVSVAVVVIYRYHLASDSYSRKYPSLSSASALLNG
jgi:hypothetical protein